MDEYAAALDNPQARPAALRRLAQLASLRASRHGRWFDLALWDRVTGDRSPRVLIAAEGLDEARRSVEGVAEEFDLFSQPPSSLRLLVGEVAVWFITLAVIAFMLAAVDPLKATVIFGAAALIGGVYFCRRAAIRLIAIRSVIASPGRIEFGGLLGAVTFTIDDAMLFVVDCNQDAAGDRIIEIILQRQDNAMRRLRVTGAGDPRIAEAIARWVAGCPAPVTPSA